MLQPSAVVNSILASLQSIPELATALGAPNVPATQSITGHYSYSGEENSLARAVSMMLSPSMLLAYVDLIEGNFDGATIWRHRLNLYVRPQNAAINKGAVSGGDLLWLAVNYPISVPYVAPNIRCVDLLNNGLWLFSLTAPHFPDELQQDLWVMTMVFNEYGDAGPDGLNFLCIGPSSMKGEISRGNTHTE